MAKKKFNALPPMAFGQDSAVVHENVKQFGDLIESVFPGLNAYDANTDAASFRSQTVVIPMVTSKIVATSVSPTTVERKNNQLLTFILPYAGDPQASTEIAGERVHWGLGQGGVFMPSCEERVIGTGEFRSQIMWQLERDRLLATANTMLGQDEQVELDLDRLRLLPLEIAGVRTDASWQAILPLLQLHRGNPNILAQLGVEDLLYRHSVMLLRPDLFTQSVQAAGTPFEARHLRRIVDPLCDYILGHLSDALTLTDLESISGMSARSLQLAFNARFGMSPMGWIKEVRLGRVHRQLQSHAHASIESIAHSTGFQTMPAFFKAYKERFGETPGQTKLRK